MDKKLLKEFEKKLKEKEKLIEKELKSFAKKDKKVKGDWDTKFPYFDGEIGGGSLEKAADEVEEYVTRLPIEYALEKKLVQIRKALRKIKSGKYGICEKCKKKISLERLKILPEATLCKKCQKK